MDHTTNYNLPLYTAQDETNYMTNWNGAMTSIDTAVKAVDDKPVVDQVARQEIDEIKSTYIKEYTSTTILRDIPESDMTVAADRISFNYTATKSGMHTFMFSQGINASQGNHYLIATLAKQSFTMSSNTIYANFSAPHNLATSLNIMIKSGDTIEAIFSKDNSYSVGSSRLTITGPF